jgi:hypothetical protein
MQASSGSGVDLVGPHGIPNGEATQKEEQQAVEQVRKRIEKTHVDSVEVVHVVDKATFERIEVSSDKDAFNNAVAGLFGESEGNDEDIPADKGRPRSDDSSSSSEVAVVVRKPPGGLELGGLSKVVDGHEETVTDPEKLGFVWAPQGLTTDQVMYCKLIVAVKGCRVILKYLKQLLLL